MFKKFAIAAPLALMALSSSVVFAAGEASHTVNLKANIPTTVFHAQPRDPNFGRDETMNYNLVSGELTPLTAIYDLKNTNGSVHAYIEGGPAVLFNGIGPFCCAPGCAGLQRPVHRPESASRQSGFFHGFRYASSPARRCRFSRY